MTLKKFALIIAAFSVGQTYTFIRINQIANSLVTNEGQRPLVIKPTKLLDYRDIRLATEPNETVFNRKYI